MVPRPLLLTGCFILAMFAGSAMRGVKASAGNDQAVTQTARPSSNMPIMPEGINDLDTRIWLAKHLPDADSAQLADIARRLGAVPNLDKKAWTGLFFSWFEKDPAAAWAFAAGQADLRGIALEEWAARDPDTARKAVATPSLDDFAALVRGALRKDVRVGFRMLGEALAAVPKGPDTANDPFAMRIFHPKDDQFAEFASIDPDAAMEWVKQLETDEFDGALFWGRWKKDPAAAREWLGQQERPDRLLHELASFASYKEPYLPALMDFLVDIYPSGNDRHESIQAILEGLAFRDPGFAAKEAARVIPDPAMRAEAIGKIACQMAQQDFDKAWALLETLDPSALGVRRTALPKIEMRCGSPDGLPITSTSSTYAESLNYTARHFSPAKVKGSLLEKLMATDKEETIRLMEHMPAKEFFPAGHDAIDIWVAREPEEAIRWLAGKLGRQGDAGYLENLVNRMDMAAQLPLLHSLPEGSVHTALALEVALKTTKADPLAALDLAREARTSDAPVIQVYDQWSESDPAAAMEHLAGDADAPPEAWGKVAKDAFTDDPEAAAEAIGKLPAGPARDIAIGSVMNSVVDGDPLRAGAWGLTLGDSGKRQAAMEKVFARLSLDLRLMRDPATAEALRQHLEDAADLPAAERQHWSERIDREFAAP